MDYPDNIQLLLEKYWNVETSLAEEAELKRYFTQNPTGPEAMYFRLLDNEREISVPASPQTETPVLKIRTFNLTLRYAATIAVIILAGFLLYSVFDNQTHQTRADLVYQDSFEDPEKAYAEAREALLLVAAKIQTTQNQAAKNVNLVEPYTNIVKPISSE
jgi:hypothetical protein